MNVRRKISLYIQIIAIYTKYRDISKNSIFFQRYDTTRYIDIENDISIFSIYRIITIHDCNIARYKAM